MGDAYAKFRADYPDFQVLKYSPDYKEMQTAIVGEWAIEVSYTDASFKMSANAAPVSPPRTKSMRLLKRQSDGEQKPSRQNSMQLRSLRLGLLQDGNVGVGVPLRSRDISACETNRRPASASRMAGNNSISI
jgi:hypothetical protein